MAARKKIVPGARLLQLWANEHFAALLKVVVVRKGVSISHYVRRAVWERLQSDATSDELKEYKAGAWRKSA